MNYILIRWCTKDVQDILDRGLHCEYIGEPVGNLPEYFTVIAESVDELNIITAFVRQGIPAKKLKKKEEVNFYRNDVIYWIAPKFESYDHYNDSELVNRDWTLNSFRLFKFQLS